MENKALQRPPVSTPTKKWVRKDLLKQQEARDWAKWEKQQNPHVGY